MGDPSASSNIPMFSHFLLSVLERNCTEQSQRDHNNNFPVRFEEYYKEAPRRI